MSTQFHELRKNAGYSTQEQLAKHLGVPRSNVAKWESGFAKPQIDIVPSIAEALSVTEGVVITAILAAQKAKAQS